MILGQLIQTGRRFCECRSRDYIPETDDLHTAIAYSVTDRFVARSFSESSPTANDEFHEWLKSQDAIAYILLSLNFNPRQDEFPPPLGGQFRNCLAITGAVPEGLTVAHFRFDWSDKAASAKLTPIEAKATLSKFATWNHFHQGEAEQPFALSEPPSFGERLLVAT